jgi:hypothetical protein
MSFVVESRVTMRMRGSGTEEFVYSVLATRAINGLSLRGRGRVITVALAAQAAEVAAGARITSLCTLYSPVHPTSYVYWTLPC